MGFSGAAIIDDEIAIPTSRINTNRMVRRIILSYNSIMAAQKAQPLFYTLYIKLLITYSFSTMNKLQELVHPVKGIYHSILLI